MRVRVPTRGVSGFLAVCTLAATMFLVGEVPGGEASTRAPIADVHRQTGEATSSAGPSSTTPSLSPALPRRSSAGEASPESPPETSPSSPHPSGSTVDSSAPAVPVRFGHHAAHRDVGPADVAPPRRYGTLQSSTTRLATNTAAGVDLATLGVVWKRFEPVEGRVDSAYLSELRDHLARFRAAGVDVVLSTGVHYPPDWLFDYPHSRFVNQYGDAYKSPEVGKKIANMVFNQQMRDKQANYLALLFDALGTDFYGVRLGGGWYGELNYPEQVYGGRTNAYWGFDPVASGTAPGLPSGMQANPVPGWLPGASSAGNGAAHQFAEWYLDSLDNYHDWQIATVRRSYPGKLLMMYPSWGVRPGQLDAAIAADLSGTTPAERNGEIPRGFDVARFIGGITDPGIVVYTTWLNADASGDRGTDMRYWSPVKYLATLAAERAQPLAVMGENTGRDSAADMALTFAQARAYRLEAVVWAFEPELYGGVHASIDDYAAEIRADRAP